MTILIPAQIVAIPAILGVQARRLGPELLRVLAAEPVPLALATLALVLVTPLDGRELDRTLDQLGRGPTTLDGLVHALDGALSLAFGRVPGVLIAEANTPLSSGLSEQAHERVTFFTCEYFLPGPAFFFSRL